MINKHIVCIVFSLITALNLHSQGDKTLRLTIEDAINLARKQSPSVESAKHSFRSAYWSNRYFKANYLPSLSFSSSPNFNHQINPITMPDGTTQFIQQNQFAVNGNLSLNQNIALTGGSISLNTGLNRIDLFGTVNSHSYMTTPISLTFRQSLNGYNSLRWDKKTYPLSYEIAKKNYVIALEYVSSNAISWFFSLASAQTNLDVALTNFQSVDTLYVAAQGRYKIGRITESEMLQMEVQRLNAETSLMNARVYLEDYIQSFRTFLGIKDTVQIEVIIDKTIPDLRIDPDKALNLALENSPTVISMQLREIEIERSVASTKANTGFQMNLQAQLGFSKASAELHSAYKDLISQQYVQVGISVPILDWGRSKGQLKMAESSRQLSEIQLEQDRISFEQTILRLVRQFNLLANQISVAEKTDYTANKRNDVTQRLYVLGRATILELNNAITEKDNAKRSYISTLANFWSSYYEIRRYTLFDFEKNILITEDYELLLNN
ncbi:MAG: TolC family protein [Prevotellaceae bacterium]|jgi:outer membrane protein TolC|nr:TolC family protein [Prevotellaceae bacterium]